MFWSLVSGEGAQKEILVADLKDVYQMLLVTFISLGLDLLSLCHVSLLSLLWCQGHVTAFVGFPTMPGMNAVIDWLFLICYGCMY